MWSYCSGLVILVRYMYICLFISLVACKENLDTPNNAVEHNQPSSSVDNEVSKLVDQTTNVGALPISQVQPQASFLMPDSNKLIDNYGSEENQQVNQPLSSVDDEVLTLIDQTTNVGALPISQVQPQASSPVPDSSKLVDENASEENLQVNHPPNAVGDDILILEDQVVILEELLLNDSDQDGDEIRITAFSQAESGIVVLVNDSVLKYIPSQDFNGHDVFHYTISDGNGSESTAQVILSVKSVNDSPLARADSFIVSQRLASTINVTANDEGLGDGAKLSIQTFPTNGKLDILNDNKLVFTPEADYFGLDNFVYQLVDSDGEVSIATVRLNIECLSNCTQVFHLSWEPSISLGVAAYRVYVGKFAHQLDSIFDIGHITNFEYPVSQKGEYFFAISAVNSDGVESELSEVMKGVF